MPRVVPNYTLPKQDSRQSAVVFVHGVHGDPRETWTARQQPPVAWPCLLRAEGNPFGRSNVYLARYRSEELSPNPTLAEAARALANEWEAAKVFSHASVTLVAHSMGGLVVARMLTERGVLTDDQRRRVRLVVFLGTPATPTEASSVCDFFGINAQCTEMKDGPTLENLWANWDALRERPAAWCLAEGSDTFFPRVMARLWPLQLWMRIVPEESAYRPCKAGGPTEPLKGFDHSQLVKPQDEGALPHTWLMAAFSKCLQPDIVEGEQSGDSMQAQAVRKWLEELQGEAKDPSRDATQVLKSRFVPSRTWRPMDPGRAVLSIDDLELADAGPAANDMRDQSPILYSQATVRWVRPVSELGAELADGAIERLTRQMIRAGGLLPDDVVLAVRTGRADPLQSLLLLRPRAPVAAATEPEFRLLGYLVVATRAAGCGSTVAAARSASR